jgi:SAM-dependent methyltransferase
MQAYNAEFARLYNLRWGGFAQSIAPTIRNFYETTPIGQTNRALLDLCCGAGQLAVLFLEAGYKVVGIDSSEPMLAHARENANRFLGSGQARFIQGDASHFVLDDRFGLALSTFDALNHLENEEALEQCFQCVFNVLEKDGFFVFDLNTQLGLRRWNSITINDSNDESLLITRGIYDEAGGKAWTRITGFVQEAGGLYRRSDLTAFNTAFELERVRKILLEGGWQDASFALGQDLKSPISEPETQSRVFIVARK